MELRYLEYYEAVARLKNFTRASEELFVSQPSISVAVKKLEDELGIKLMKRNKKNVELTPEGEIFYTRISEILDKLRETIRYMDTLKATGTKILSLAFPPVLGSKLWDIILLDFVRKHPNIELDIRDMGNTRVIDSVEKKEVELGFGVFTENMPDDIEKLKLLVGEMVVVLPADSRLKDEETIRLEHIVGERVIMYKQGTSFMENKFKELFRNKVRKPEILYCYEQITVYNLVAEGYGITFTLNEDSNFVKNNPKVITKPFELPIHFDAGIMWNSSVFLSETSRLFIRKLQSDQEG